MASVVAAQLYTLRNFTKTPADIAKTIAKVKKIGYDAVQSSALGPIDVKELAKILDSEGVVCCATHESFEKMQKEPQAVIDYHQALKCSYTAPGSMPERYATAGAQGYRLFAKDASEVAKRLKAGGLTFGYHNHAFEMAKVDGRVGLELLYAESDPLVTAEIDTYWVTYGGGDPAACISKLKGRIPLVHLKDMAFGREADFSPARKEGENDADFKRRTGVWGMKQLMAEVGEGNLNWDAILKACREAGVVWYIVEQDVCQRDPFESLAISKRNLQKMGVV